MAYALSAVDLSLFWWLQTRWWTENPVKKLLWKLFAEIANILQFFARSSILDISMCCECVLYPPNVLDLRKPWTEVIQVMYKNSCSYFDGLSAHFVQCLVIYLVNCKTPAEYESMKLVPASKYLFSTFCIVSGNLPCQM